MWWLTYLWVRNVLGNVDINNAKLVLMSPVDVLIHSVRHKRIVRLKRVV